MKKAFSLIEVAVTLIIIAVIFSALAPFVTKKLISNERTVGGGGAGAEKVIGKTMCGILHGKNCIELKESCTSFSTLHIYYIIFF
jgi:prepilin-type N-terminal cleavage/methylation domain-containing protein